MKTELAGRRLAGRYLLETPLDSGGMADVWQGVDEVLGRPVAVKILHGHLAQDADFLDRFRLEAVAAARLSHPAVVRVFDTGVDEDLCYIVMELSEGRNLADLLAERRRLEPGEAVAIARALLDALSHAHGAGVIHRDVKPGNALVGADGTVKMTDFGIAKAAFAGDVTTTGKLLGTARYLAPEQVADQPVDHRADLYALGIVLYEMLTGRVPFQAETDLATATMRLTKDPIPPGSMRAGIPRALDRVVMRALARDPDDRFASAEEMRAALDRAVPEDAAPRAGPVERGSPPDELTARSFVRSWLSVPMGLLLVAAVAVGGGLLLGRLQLGGPLGIRPAPDEPGAGAWRIVSAEDHDPEGDGAEHPEDVAMAIDESPDTAWSTERYATPDLGGAKAGVGLLLDLGRTREIGAVRIVSPLRDWRFELLGSEDGRSFTDPLSSADGRTSFVTMAETSVELVPVRQRYLLIWITELAPSEDGYRAQVADVDVLAPS